MNRIATTILATALTATAAGSITTGPVAAAPERVPELVSNTDTNGSDIKQVMRLSADGRSVAWYSLAAYPGSHGANGAGVYTGNRTDSGWKVTPFWPDTSMVRPGFTSLIGGYVFPGDLSSMSAVTFGSFDPADDDIDARNGVGAIDAYKFDADGNSTWISRPQGVPGGLRDAQLVGLSEDGSTVFFTTPDRMTPDVPDGMSQLYRWRNGSVEAVGRDATGELISGGAILGNGTSFSDASGDGNGVPDSFGVSSDGTRFVYREPPSGQPYSRTFFHEDGAGTSEISLSQRSGSVGQPAPTGAVVMAATPDLRKVYLQSPDQLTDDAPVGGGDYVYDTDTRELAFSNVDNGAVEQPGAFSAGQRSGVVRVSDDGEYVYFLSSAALVPGGQADGRNLYLKHGGEVRLIAVLDPTDKDDGLAVGPTRNVPSPEYTQSGLSADGTRLVFISSASLAGFDTGGFRSAYLYDASTQDLKCISCRPDGRASEGEAAFKPPPGSYNTPNPRVISADGSIVGFASDDALVPEDTNGTTDVYEYSDGRVRLISAGTSRFPSTFAGLSPDGADLYFVTRDSLSPEDANRGFSDLYDARVGGRRAPGRASDVGCSGDDCQGRLATRPVTPSAGSVTFTGAGDQPGLSRPAAVGRSITVAKLKTITGTAATLKAKVPSAGALSVHGSGVASETRTTTEAGTYSLKVRLTAAAKRTLKRKATLTITARVAFTPKAGKATATSVKVTFKQRRVSARGGR